MINKQSILLLTLFSLILVLSVYYITMPSEFDVSVGNTIKENNKKVVNIKENDVISTLKVEKDEERNKKIKELQTILTKDDATTEEKNNAYEELKNINLLKGKEEEISKKINEDLKIDNVVQIKDDQVRVILIKKEHDVTTANNVMNLVQSKFKDKMYITVKFQK